MGNDTLITRAPGGTEERQVRAIEIEIPDVWHLAINLHTEEREMVLETWHLCHDLLAHIREE